MAGAGDDAGHVPDLSLMQLVYELQTDNPLRPADAVRADLMDRIKADNMLPFYEHVCATLGWKADAALVKKMRQSNSETEDKIAAQIKDAEENLGDVEVREGLLARADHFARIGDKDKALAAYAVTLDKTVPIGQKLDVVLTQIRLGLFFGDVDLVSRNVDKAKDMVERGGDWERRNRLKIYEATYFMTIRNFEKAATLLLDGLSTFTATELYPYQQFIFYAVVMSVVALDRVALRTKVVDAPEILTSILDIPHLSDFLTSIFECKYATFLVSLAEISDRLRKDRYVGPHIAYFTRECRVKAYSQFLESYMSVTIDSMAATFGVGPAFMDRELSRFIASGRLHCKIDMVAGVVETNRPDSKNAQYQATIRSGDQLLNRIQKLSRVINL